MAVKLINFDERLSQAVRFFWRGRRDAAKKQQTAGKADQGNRGAVTGGKNLDAFRDMIVDVVHRHGPEGCEVHRGKSMVVLPGFFRPTKQWDLLIVFQNRLLAAFELKSLCGPSFGNNANNRCEEAIGSGYDFRKAQSEGLFGPGASPFLGYFILVAPKESKCGDSSHLSNPTAFRFLLSRLAGHLASEADLVGGPETRFKDEPAVYESGSLLAGECFSSIEPLEKTGLTQP